MTSRRHRSSALLVIAACAVSFTWFCAWMAGLVLDAGSWPLRYTLLGLGFLLAAGLVAAWMMLLAREQRTAQRHFDVLSRLTPCDLASDQALSSLPALPVGNPWSAAARLLRKSLADSCRRVQEAEHDRATLEVRLQQVRSEAEQIRAILDGLSEPVVAIDSFDDLVLANPSAVDLLDLDLDDPEARAVRHLVHCEKLLELLTDTRRRRTPTQRSGEVELPEGKGATRWYQVTTATIDAAEGTAGPDDDSPRHGAVAVLRDISGHKAAQKRNAEFVSSVSHEMKTPLAGIKAYVELLADGDAEDDATRDEFLSVINAQTDRLQRLIDNLLNLARIEAGVVNVSKQQRSLNDLLEEAQHVVAPSAEQKQIDLVLELSPMYLGVLVDRDMIMQAAINLLSNAVKYTAPGGTVTLRSRTMDHEVQFEVQDTGVGLSPEDCEKVFDKFYRVRKDRKMAQGTGLGLPLAKHIVEDVHGGRLAVQSCLGEGSTFVVTLPAARELK